MRDVHGDHRAQAGLGNHLAAPLGQQPAEPARRGGQDDVVEGAAKGALDRAEVVELDGEDGEPALRADRLVQARVGRRDHLVADDQLGERRRVPERVAGPRGVRDGVDGGLDSVKSGLTGADGCISESQSRTRQTPQGAAPQWGGRGHLGEDLWRGPGAAVGAAVRPLLGALALGVEQGGRDVDGADPVNHAVVGLGDQRPAPVSELEHHDLPERLGAVQAL